MLDSYYCLGGKIPDENIVLRWI